MCLGAVNFEEFEDTFNIDFSDHFAPELEALATLEDDGLLNLGDNSFQATPAGRLLLRAIAMVFDEYLAEEGRPAGFSKVI